MPRLINLACHNMLISGIVYESRKITKEIAVEAAGELSLGIGQGHSHETSDSDEKIAVYS